MTKPVISCFSDSKSNLNLIISELHKHYGSVINQTIFEEHQNLIDSLSGNKLLCQNTKLFVIDLRNTTVNFILFIKIINQFCPNAVKLIIAENENISIIRNSAENNESMLFLKSPLSSDDFKHALCIADEIYTHKSYDIYPNLFDSSFEEKVEEKVNQRLQKLIDANLAKDSFLSIITHDLKSPFVALLGISEILLKEWETLSEEIKLELVGDLHKTSVDTYKLLETLLEWAKLQKEKLEVTINEVKVHNLVDATLKVSENNALVKGIKIQNKIDNDIKVRTDENMIATVFRNLISNAVQYTQPGGMIDITAKKENEYCMFCVADNGSGIDKPHILELFNRGSHKKINGNASAYSGLGLIICKDFVEKSGGQIWLETKKGQGSKFFFTIPC